MLGNWKKVWQVASVYIGTIVGAGFATGKEIVEFFSRFGFLGFLSILIAGYLFIYFGTKMMVSSIQINAQDYFAYNRWLFGKRFSSPLNVVFFIMLLGATSVLVAGAGEVFFHQFGFNRSLGMFLTCALAVIVMIWGLKGLSLVNMFVVPLMIFFNLALASVALTHGFTWDKFFAIPAQPHQWLTLVLPFGYVAFNLSLAQAVFTPLAKEIGDPVIIRRGAILGGALLTVILIGSHLSLISYPSLQVNNIPTATVMQAIAPFLHDFYILIIFGEIFSSVIGNAFGLERQIFEKFNIASLTVYIVIFAICLSVAQFEYAPLLTLLYPLFGYISSLFLVVLFFKKID